MNKLRYCLDRNRLGELLVLNGAITAHELRYALVRQRATHAPLGRVLVEEDMVRRRQLYRALAQQWMLRLLIAGATLTLSLSIFGVKQARAGGRLGIPAQVRLVSVANAAFTPISYYPPLLGSTERESPNLKPFTKWTQMFDHFQASLETSTGQREVAVLKKELEPLKGLPLKVMAERVNSLMNEVPYVEDSQNWGKSDYWETPVEFLSRGGDCEDFAIAKYVSLRALGVPADRLRVVIVKDLLKNLPHAVLAVYTNDGALILDNQSHEVRRAASLIGRYKPIFSINRDGWWLHTVPQRTVLASAR